MIRTDKRLRICVTLLILILVFIWGNSLMPGTVSQAISNWVQRLFMDAKRYPAKICPFHGICSLGHDLSMVIWNAAKEEICALSVGYHRCLYR